MSTNISIRSSIVPLVLGLMLTGQSPAIFAQNNKPAAKALEEVTVTARKREESLADAPLAISALTADDMESAGIEDLTDVVAFTPGVQFENNSVGVPGRVFTDIRFRGLGNELVEPFAQVGSVFLDGVQMFGGVSSIGTENIERVEVVKGPSSAFFGRSTFAGAVNYITKTPSLEEYSGRLTLKYAEYNTYNWTAAHEGPIIEDKLGYRVFVRGYGTDGQYTSDSDGGALGEESTRTVMATLYAEPTDNLSMKFRGMYSKDDDGPPAVTWLGNSSSRRGQGPNFANCFQKRPELQTALKRNQPGTSLTDFICGEVPVTGLTDPNTQIVSDQVLPFFDMVPIDGAYPDISEIGLEREQIRVALHVDYEFDNGYSISSVSSLDDERVNMIRDIDSAGANNWLNIEQSRNESIYQELRLASPSDQRITWLLGLTYFNGETRGHYLGGGESVVASDGGMTEPGGFDIDQVLGNTPDNVCPCAFFGFVPPPVNEFETLGVFGSIGVDLLEQVHLDFEWRYQEDKLRNRDVRRTSIPTVAQPYATGNGTELGASFDNFLPRATLQYTPFENTNLWFTYSLGNNPGFFNEALAGLSPAQLAANPGLVNEAPLFLEEEELENFEIGWKQILLDGRASFSVVGYMMEWTNQKTRTGVLVNEPGGVGQQVETLAVQGFSTDLMGVEFEGTLQLTDRLGMRGSFTYSDAEFQNFECGFTDDFAPANSEGVVDCSGNTPLQFPEWSASFSLMWTDVFKTEPLLGWNYFARLDGMYQGEQYTDEQNFSFIGDYWQFNLRGGIRSEDLRFEVFVTNLLDEDQYLAGGRVSDFSSDRGTIFPFEFSNNQGLGLVPANKRQIGARISYDF